MVKHTCLWLPLILRVSRGNRLTKEQTCRLNQIQLTSEVVLNCPTKRRQTILRNGIVHQSCIMHSYMYLGSMHAIVFVCEWLVSSIVWRARSKCLNVIFKDFTGRAGMLNKNLYLWWFKSNYFATAVWTGQNLIIWEQDNIYNLQIW